MNKTPRTDAQLKLEAFFDGIGVVETVEVEFAQQLETELAEARAEIERLKSEHEDSLRRAKDNAVSLSGTVTEYAGELFVKNKLIEQMREALKSAGVVVDFYEANNNGAGRGIGKMIKAALAAERGEK